MRSWRRLAHARLAISPVPLRAATTGPSVYYRPVHNDLNTESSAPRNVDPVAFAQQTRAQEKTISHGQLASWSGQHTNRSNDRPTPLKSAHAPGKIPLPTSCPGCGALTQEADTAEPGFYRKSRKAVRAYLKLRRVAAGQDEDSQTEAEQSQEPSLLVVGVEAIGTNKDVAEESVPIPVCERCHDLLYNLRAVPIAHPSLEDIADSIAESPFSRNHVYHVLDAADFPMSLEPKIISQLSLAKPRSQNRRSQHSYEHKPTLSFIITRSDLLAPTKEKVDRMMAYFQTVLRMALGRAGQNLRLGNVHLVSAKRGWWTTEIKESIWKRGGGNWMVGKFNVGKSNLFEVLFPKGSGERAPSYAELAKQQATQKKPAPELLPESGLLPPPQPESPFPALPLVSNLPGTTASPIRLPFGNHKGELIDLPGLERGNLDKYVHQDHKLDLVMTSRPKVAQHNIKPGQSLLLGGGLIRITPGLDMDDPSTTMMAYPFVPLEAHVTSTEKAIGVQQQNRESGIETILAEHVGDIFKCASTITLDTDVTKQHAGPLLRAGVSADRLPFRVYSTDLIIQGVGWVELVCQVRRRKRYQPASSAQVLPPTDEGLTRADGNEVESEGTTFKPYAPALEAVLASPDSPSYPSVGVFTPEGKHISKRIPLGAWTLWKEGGGKIRRAATSNRPRPSMRGAKKRGEATRIASAAWDV